MPQVSGSIQGLYGDCMGFRDTSPIMDNQVEKQFVIQTPNNKRAGSTHVENYRESPTRFRVYVSSLAISSTPSPAGCLQ